MGERLRKRARRVAMVFLVLAAGMVAQGCVLERKTIIDAYDFVFGVPVGVSFVFSEIIFPNQYCIPAGNVRFNARLDPLPGGMTQLALVAVIIAVDGVTQVDRHAFPLRRRNGRFRGFFSIESFCIEAGETLRWQVKPRGAGIVANSRLESFFEYLAGDLEK